MSTMKISSNKICTATVISNVFIDSYMPKANGEYVKVYIYLIRCLSDGTIDLGISQLADHLDSTETDVIRALNYWEHEGLLTLEKNPQGEIYSVTLEEPVDKNAEYEDITPIAAVDTEIAVTVVPEAKPEVERPTYTEAQIAELTNTDEVKWLMNIIEIYLERLLTPTDIQLILYLYETLGFSTDLIMHLYDYCVSKGKKNPAYIEAVAHAWAEEGIDSVEKAEISSTKYNTNYNAINKAFGLNRQPGAIEKKFMDKWISSFKFSTDVIVEACNRTLLRTGKPDFKYADKILENWYGKGVKNTADISKLDQKFNSKAQSAPKTASSHAQKPKANNQFNAFPQRNYSKEDFSSLEQRLLNKH